MLATLTQQSGNRRFMLNVSVYLESLCMRGYVKIMKFVVEMLVIDHSCMAKIDPRNISEWLLCDVGEATTLRKKGVKES